MVRNFILHHTKVLLQMLAHPTYAVSLEWEEYRWSSMAYCCLLGVWFPFVLYFRYPEIDMHEISTMTWLHVLPNAHRASEIMIVLSYMRQIALTKNIGNQPVLSLHVRRMLSRTQLSTGSARLSNLGRYFLTETTRLMPRVTSAATNPVPSFRIFRPFGKYLLSACHRWQTTGTERLETSRNMTLNSEGCDTNHLHCSAGRTHVVL